MREWAEGTGRVHFHFVPTSSSWLNLVERFFSTLTQKRIRRGVFHSVPHFESYLKQYIETYNNRLTSLPSLTHPGDDRSGHLLQLDPLQKVPQAEREAARPPRRRT